MNLQARLGASLTQGLDETLATRVVVEDGFASVAAIHDVINRAGIFDSDLARHEGSVAAPPQLLIITPASGVSSRAKSPACSRVQITHPLR